MFRLFRTSIVFRSAFIVLGIAFLIGGFFSVFSYHFFASSEQEQAGKRMLGLLSTVENTASIACYLSDRILATELSQGLLKNGDVSRVRILSGDKLLAEASKPADHLPRSGSALRNPAPIRIERDIFSPFNPKEKVCSINLEPNLEVIREQSSDKASFIVYLLILQGLLIASAVVYVVLNLITRPIKTISDRLHRLSVETGERISLPAGNEKDEIGQLVRDVNTLVGSLVKTLEEERTLRIQHEIGEKKFQAIFENAETGIFQMNVSGQIISHNQAFCNVLALDQATPAEQVALALTCALEGQELRLYLMIDSALSEARVMSDDFCIEVGAVPQKKWLNLVITPAEDGVLQGLVNDITERKLSEEAANLLAVTDHLTGVHNRLGLEKELNRLASETLKGNGGGFFLLLIDLDKFKQVNDVHGHAAGDKVLCHFTRILIKTLRKTDFIARLGGDEFVVLLKNMTQLEKAENIAQDILWQTRQAIPISEALSVQIGASIGISVAGAQSFNKAELLRQADSAMYAVKHSGKNNYRVYRPEAPPG